MTDDNGSGPKTPPETPSALYKLGLAVCPACLGIGKLNVMKKEIKCQFCDGARRVTVEKATMWFQVKS